MGVSGAMRAKYLLPWCYIHDSLKFNMQNDHVLEMLNFDVFNQDYAYLHALGNHGL